MDVHPTRYGGMVRSLLIHLQVLFGRPVGWRSDSLIPSLFTVPNNGHRTHIHICSYPLILLYIYIYICIHIMHRHVHRHIHITYTHLLMLQPQLHATPAPKPRGFHSPIFYAHPTWCHSLDHVIQVWTQGRIWSGAISGQVVIYWRYLLYI